MAALIDARKASSAAAREAAERAGARYLSGAVIERVRGGQGVRSVEVRDAAGKTERFDCDLVAVSGGWSPTVHLTTHLNGKPHWSEALSALVPGTLPPGMSVAGAASGTFGLATCLAQGQSAGAAAAAECGFAAATARSPAATDESGSASSVWQVAKSRGKAFVDFQNDVTVSDVKLAAREGFRVPEHLKRYTTLGMATDQGKTGNAQRRGGARIRHRALYRRGRHARPSARPSPRSPSAPLPAITAGRISAPRVLRRRMVGPRSRAPSSSRPGLGFARSIIRKPARSRRMR